MLNNKKAFTISELIVVITILAILSTIAYMSFSSYLLFVRDTSRFSQLQSISEGLESRMITSNLPMPDDYVEVRVNGKVIGYQGYAGKDVLATISYSENGKDPKTNTYYSYYLTKNRKYFQLLTHLENEDSSTSFIGGSSVFAVDYSGLYNGVLGSRLGILTDEFNTPIQEVPAIKTATFVDLTLDNANDIFISNVENNRKYVFSGSLLSNKLETLSDPGKYGPPKYCPEGFVGAWGDAGFNQKGFCVAKYEMGYTDETGAVFGDTLNNFATYDYDDTKEIISTIGRYPIANIDLTSAKFACESLGKGFHLIRESEWMSIARDIEFLQENWSSGKIGNGYITSGLSGDSSDSRWCYEGGVDYYYDYKSGIGNEACNKKRQHKLFSGEYIWDLAGGIWEHVDKGITDTINLGTGDIYWNNSQIDSNERVKFGPLINSDPNAGIGGIFNSDGATSSTLHRGGSAWDGAMSGIYSLDPATDGSNKEWNLGFRCAKSK